MDIRFYETFIAVAKTRHFGQAALQMHISQSTVSSRIKQLEAYHDTSLFLRIRNNVTLTSAGERLVAHAELISSTSMKAKLELSLEKGKTHQIKIAATPNVWDAYLHRTLSNVSDKFEKYSLIADFQSKDQLKLNLLHGTLDIAFSFDPIISTSILSNKICDVTLGLFHTNIGEEGSTFKYIHVDWGGGFSMAQNTLLGQDVIPSMRTSSCSIALNYMMRNKSAAYLPLRGMQPQIAGGMFSQNTKVKVWQQAVYLNYSENNLFDEVITFFKEIGDQ